MKLSIKVVLFLLTAACVMKTGGGVRAGTVESDGQTSPNVRDANETAVLNSHAAPLIIFGDQLLAAAAVDQRSNAANEGKQLSKNENIDALNLTSLETVRKYASSLLKAMYRFDSDILAAKYNLTVYAIATGKRT